MYSGCTALIVGNSVKAGVRFVSYDRFKNLLKDGEVSILIIVSFAYNANHSLLPRGKSARRVVF